VDNLCPVKSALYCAKFLRSHFCDFSIAFNAVCLQMTLPIPGYRPMMIVYTSQVVAQRYIRGDGAASRKL
jgi:hypothetical protein